MNGLSTHDYFGSPKTTMLPPALSYPLRMKPGTARPTSTRRCDETLTIQIDGLDGLLYVDGMESFLAHQAHDDHDEDSPDHDDDLSEAQSETMHDGLSCTIDFGGGGKLDEYHTSYSNRKASIQRMEFYSSGNQEGGNVVSDDECSLDPASLPRRRIHGTKFHDFEYLSDDESETIHDDSSYEIDLPEEFSHGPIKSGPKHEEDSMPVMIYGT